MNLITALVLMLSKNCFLQHAMSNTVHNSFYLVSSPSYGCARLDHSWTAFSLVSCAVTCLHSYTACGSLMFNNTTKLCTPGAALDPLQPAPSNSEGDLYQIRPYCDTSKGFTRVNLREATKCIGFFRSLSTHDEAERNCTAKGGKLLNVIYEEMTSFLSVFYFLKESIWVDCQSAQNVNLYEFYNPLYTPPLTVGGSECCILTVTEYYSIYYVECNMKFYYAFEFQDDS